jgi:opacity protein-like surface antigen
MIRRITMFVVAALLMTALALPAFAASAGERACLAQNDPDAGVTAEWVRIGPGQYECQVTTTTETNPGNPQSDNAATPKKNSQINEQEQQGQGVGGGAQGDFSSLNCQYNNSGKLQASKSDEGCPATQP